MSNINKKSLLYIIYYTNTIYLRKIRSKYKKIFS